MKKIIQFLKAAWDGVKPVTRNDRLGVAFYALATLLFGSATAVILLAIKETTDRQYNGGEFEKPDVYRNGIVILLVQAARLIIFPEGGPVL